MIITPNIVDKIIVVIVNCIPLDIFVILPVLKTTTNGVMNYTLRLLSGKKTFEISREIRCLPKDMTSLDLSVNFLGRRTIYELNEIFTEIPASVTSLDLGVNLLNLRSCAELVAVFSAIQATVITLNLGGNSLFLNKSRMDLSMIFANTPAGVTSLGLSYNNFDCKAIAAVISSIPSRVTSIDLRGSNLGEVPIDDIIQLIKLIPRHVKFLDLGESFLNDRSAEEIKKITAAIPPGLSINIGWYNHPIIIEMALQLPAATISAASVDRARLRLPSVVESSARGGDGGAKSKFFPAVAGGRPSTAATVASHTDKLPPMMGAHAARR